MLQRIGPSGSRLATGALPSGIAAGAELAAGSTMHVRDGAVAADFRASESRGKRELATYELMVSNDTSQPLATFAYAVEGPGNRKQITWNAIVVPPFSAISVDIDVAIPRRRRMPRVVAELFSDDVSLTLDAAPSARRRWPTRRTILAASAAFALALGGGAFAQTQAHVIALAAPDSVRAGVPFPIAYAFAHATEGRYVIETPDGLQILRGTLPDRSGAFTVALPASIVSSGYDVRVSATGRFGSDERTTHVTAMPSAPTAAPKPHRESRPAFALGALALDHDVVHAGESIVVTYRPSTDPGIVRLIDSVGTVRAEALLTHRGQSILVAPQVDVDQDFRIVATVQRGGKHDETTTPVTILHAAAPIAAPAATIAAIVTAPKTQAPIAVDREQIVGRPIAVRVDRYERALRVALMGASTDEIVSVDVAPGETSVVLTPPILPVGKTYEVVATYTSGLGGETLVRPVVFRAP